MTALSTLALNAGRDDDIGGDEEDFDELPRLRAKPNRGPRAEET